jgi:hypothetical protein
MPTSQITFLKGDKISSNTDYRDALPTNMYAVDRPMFGAQGYMKQEAGLTLHGVTAGRTRGGLWNERVKQHYRVEGSSLVKIDKFGNQLVIGTILGADTVSLPYSFDSQVIIGNGNFYRFSEQDGLQISSDPIANGVIDSVWIDGFYFCTNGEDLFHTLAADELAFEAGTRVAEFMPDDSIGVGKTQDDKAIVFGRYTAEYFVNTGNPTGFVFERISGRTVKAGIVGTHCKTELDGKWYILGGRKEESPTIRILSVGQTQKVASKEVDQILGQYTEDELKTAVLESYAEDGYSFVIVHLPNETLKFNETIVSKVGVDAAWSIIKTGTGSQPWRGKHGVNDPRLSVWIFGDKVTGQVGILDSSVATQYGEIAEWLLSTPFLYLDKQSIRKLEIEVITGHTVDEDATIAVSLTYDGVVNSNEWFEMYGDPNDYNKRFIIRRLGRVHDWVGIILRGASRSRMAFGRGMIEHG